jgi:transposase
VAISQNGIDLIQGCRRRFGMAPPVLLRGDFDGPALRALALSEKAGSVTRRLLALVTIYDGGTRHEAARLGGVGLQTIRDWVLRFNLKGPDGLADGKSTGHPSKLNDEQRRALVAMVEAGPVPAIHGVVRWRLIDLAQWIFDEYAISVTKQILSRELRALGYRKLSARPRHHEHDEAAVLDFKKKSPLCWRPSRRKTAANRLSCGSKTKPVSAKKTRLQDAGHNAARGPSR